MPSESRNIPGLEDRLYKEFFSFSFFKAVELLESFSPDKKSLGKTLSPAEEPVRFVVKPGFGFPASDISGLEKTGENDSSRMEVTFMGLIGPSGILPHWYNQLVLDRLREKDVTLYDFLNLFHHRLITLFYLAWKKHHFNANYIAKARDRISGYLASMLGLGTDGLTERLGFPLESLTYFSGLLSRPIPSAVAIEATVGSFAQAPARVEQFVNRMLPLDPEDQTQLGRANARLGVDTACGGFFWESRTRFRVHLGPIGYDEYRRFMPDGDLLTPVFSLIRFMAGIEFEFEVRIYLKREEIPPCDLGAGPGQAPRLGLTSWVKSPQVIADRDPYVTFCETDPGEIKSNRNE